MLKNLLGKLLIAAGSFSSLVCIVFEFFRVRAESKRTVSPRTMVLILFCLFLACVGGELLLDYYQEAPLDSASVSAEPSPIPPPSHSQPPETAPPLSTPSPAPSESAPVDSPPPASPTESAEPSPVPKAPEPTSSPAPAEAPQNDFFLLDTFNNRPSSTTNFHLEYCGPQDTEFQLQRFPLSLPMVPGYYYVKIYRDGINRLLAQASFYVDDSVSGYAIGFRRVLSWGLYDVGEVDEDCLLCSWGYRAMPSANLCLTLVDGVQYSASGLEVRVRCEDFDSDVFCCTYREEPLWFSLAPDHDYSITVCFDRFIAAECSFHLTEPQDGAVPRLLPLQLG